MKKMIVLLLTLMVSSGLLSACGPTPEEQLATAAYLTAEAATSTPIPSSTPTPTNTPTATATPIPYDLSLLISGVDGNPVEGAVVLLYETETGNRQQISDQVGQAFWYGLPGSTIRLSVKAQGYFPLETAYEIERGVNQISIILERDPHGLLPADVCGPGQKLLYIEDFQDGKAQGWEQIEMRTMGWEIIPHPDSQGNQVLFNGSDTPAGAENTALEFEAAVWRIQFMTDHNQWFSFNWRIKYDYDEEAGHVDSSSYITRFEPFLIEVVRQKYPQSPHLSLGGYGVNLRKGEWHLLEIATYQGNLEVWLDGMIRVSYPDPSPPPGGGLVLGTDEILASPQNIYFDNLVVCELTAPYIPLQRSE